MDAPLDLYRASREELIALVLRQRERIADLEREQTRVRGELATQQAAIVALQERVGALVAALDPPDGGAAPARPTAMPGLKPGKDRRARRPHPRRRRAHGFGRPRMRPTARQVHAVDRCPHCGEAPRGGTRKRTRKVIDVAPGRVDVTEHVYVERRCPRCHGRWLPGPGLTGQILGQGRLGLGVVSRIAVLREELRLPSERIQW